MIRRGYSLLEMLTVLVMLAVLLGLGTTLLLTAMRADRLGSVTLDELTRRAELADQFRADVARAADAPALQGKLTAGPACLILRVGDALVIYRWHDGRLDRVTRAGGKETSRPIALNAENTTVEFVRPAGDRPLITVRVVETSPRGAVKTVEISAALGGDVR